MLLAGLLPATARSEVTARVHFQRERARASRAIRELGVGEDAVQWAAQRTRPAAIRGLRVRVAGATDAERARHFLAAHPALFVPADAAALQLVDVQGTTGLRVARFQQLVQGLPVEGAFVTVSLDDTGQVRAVASEAEPLRLTSTRPAQGAAAATRAALHALGLAGRDARGATVRLAVLAAGPRLVYRVMLPFTVDPQGRVHLVDAVSGAYLGWRRGIVLDPLPGHAAASAEVRR